LSTFSIYFLSVDSNHVKKFVVVPNIISN